MAVTLVTTPDLHALTKGGRMNFSFSGSGRVATAGVRAVNTIQVAGVVAAGTFLNLRWNGKTYKLKFVANPSAPGEMPAGDGSNQYILDLADALSAYFPIRADFRVQVNTFAYIIELTARQAGKAYNFQYQLAAVNQGVSAFNVQASTPGADPTYRTQYSVYCEVWVQKIGTPGTDINTHFELAAPGFPVDFKADDTTEFDVGGILHSKLQADLPIWYSAAPQKASRSVRRYFLAYGEAYGSPLQPGQIYFDQIRIAYLGGADFAHKSGAGFSLSDFESKALRFGPLTRYVRVDEPQFLSFINVSEAAYNNLNIRVTLTYTDNSTQVIDDFAETQQLAIGEKITWVAGGTQLGIPAKLTPGKTLKEYSVKILLDGAAWSPVYRYVLNGAYNRYTRYFAYLSSLGVIDTVTTYGKGSAELQRVSEQAERHLPTGYDPQDGQFVDYDVRIQTAHTVTTGFYSQVGLKIFNDFYRSEKRFRIIISQAIAISLVSKSIKLAKDGDSQFAHIIEYVDNFQNEFYTGDEEAGDGELPAGFIPMGGTVVVSQPTVVHATDPTVPDFLRNLTQEQFNKILAAASRPNPEGLGYLTEETASTKFRRDDEPISWTDDIDPKPTTRDDYGLTDVPTTEEIEHLTAGGLRLPAEAASDQVDGLIGHIGGQAVTMTFPSVWKGLLASGLTVQQVALLRAALAVTLDEVLKNGPESGREQTIKASHRRSLTLADSLEYIQGTFQVGSLHEERYLSAKELAKALTPDLDFDTIVSVVLDRIGQGNDTDFEWEFGSVLACEDQYKTFARDDFDNTDYQ